MSKEIILILGGARSGKSLFAQHLASELGQRVLFIATARATDDEMRRRIELHRKARPGNWQTVESPTGVSETLRLHAADADVVVLDCLTVLMSNLMESADEPDNMDALEQEVISEVGRILNEGNAILIVVSNEVGMGLVPVYPAGRTYRDLLGKANQVVAERADRVYLMVAGIPQRLKGGG